MKKNLIIVLGIVFATLISAPSFGQEENDSIKVKKFSSKEEGNRNVMLNAESNTGPREVNIGLPYRGDIVILENDVPVVAYFWPTIPTYAWRMSNSFGAMGLLSFSEGALTWGKVGFAVKSEDRGASRKFRGYASVFTDNFGSSKFDVTLTGPLGKKGWGYMLNAYQHNNKTNGTNYQFTSWGSKTSQLKALIEKKYSKGSVRLMYKMVDSKSVFNNNAPLMYLGDGETEALDNFDPGTDSYIVGSGIVPYTDPRTGEVGYADLGSDKFRHSESHNLYLSGNHKFKNGMKLTYSTMFQKMNTPIGLTYPISANIYNKQSILGQTTTAYYLGSNREYEGEYAQLVTNQLIPQSDITTWMTRAELTKKANGHALRLGLTNQYNKREYESLGGLYVISVEPNPSVLYVQGSYYGYPFDLTSSENGLLAGAGGYGGLTDDSFNKTALYVSDDFSPAPWLDLGLGGRIERLSKKDRHYTAVSGNEVVTAGGYVDGELNDWNYVGLGNAVVKLTKNFGLLGSFTYNSWMDTYWDYAYKDENNVPVAAPGEPYPRTTESKSYRQDVIYYDGGIFLNLGEKLNIVSKLTHIEKNGIYDSGSLITYKKDPTQKQDVGPLFYGLSTTGWSTDIVSSPFKNFNIHFLLTLQSPEYKDYAFTTRFSDPTSGEEDVESYDYNGKIYPGLSKVLMEIDPSYSFMKRKMKAWFSLRYFGKQYGNRTNAFEYNGWWENFGGLDYTMSRNVAIKLQVVNFLNQRGIKGEVQGAAQTTKEEVAQNYVGHPIVASALRPRTFELTVNFKF
ncbi:hypothetical protein [Plebeiibacterium marinum]|uniref:TonB-dependent receptor n=1 Tax=Plebeiibacterium marinum TaxID=2992111 RepID=A0AAE3MGR3_9BACT|nr:hypothetical protein [Plebeiobacterium marinum]MCW3807357.1 hypothetical protein [Plebeiobacterium marinum]